MSTQSPFSPPHKICRSRHSPLLSLPAVCSPFWILILAFNFFVSSNCPRFRGAYPQRCWCRRCWHFGMPPFIVGDAILTCTHRRMLAKPHPNLILNADGTASDSTLAFLIVPTVLIPYWWISCIESQYICIISVFTCASISKWIHQLVSHCAWDGGR